MRFSVGCFPLMSFLLLPQAAGCNSVPNSCPTIDGNYTISYQSPARCPIDAVTIPVEGDASLTVRRNDTTVHSTFTLLGCEMDLDIAVVRNNNLKTVSQVIGRVLLQDDDNNSMHGYGRGTRFDESFEDRARVACEDNGLEVYMERE